MKHEEGSRGARTRAREGDVCRRILDQDDTGSITVCKQPLPPGTLPYVAINSGTGRYLMLCTECREGLQKVNAGFLAAEVSSARLEGSFTELSEGKLISEEEMKQILNDKENLSKKRGPMSKTNRLRAVEYAYGEHEAKWLADKYFGLPSV